MLLLRPKELGRRRADFSVALRGLQDSTSPGYIHRPVLHLAFVLHLHPQRVRIQNRIQGLQRPRLPALYLLDYRIGDLGDQLIR